MSAEIPKVSDEMRELVEEFETASHNFGRSNTAQENGEAVKWEAKRTASRDALLSAVGILERQKTRRDRHIKRLERRLAEVEEELTEYIDLDGMDNNDALQIVCRAFDDWEPIWEEWKVWYVPKNWFHMSRGLGAFLRGKILALSSESKTP